jgi:hypothetical protein
MKKGMKNLRWFSLLLTGLLLAVIVFPVLAQDYAFEVPQASADIKINSDGTATLDYVYQFKNSPGALAIDFVDLGLPNGNYSLSNVTASVNGIPIRDIQDSPYVTPGIALGMGNNSIPAGSSGTVTIRITNIEKMLFVGSAKETEAYASFNFQPNYFDSKFVNGTTALTVSLHLPPGIKETEPRYIKPSNWPGSADPVATMDNEGRVVYQWSAQNANSGSKYKFGATFPARLVPESSISTAQSITFNFSDVFAVLTPVLCCGGFIVIFVFGIISAVKTSNKRKLQYLPPKIAVEGHGIKRGLTAVEAAILMEQPMDKILTMILFSALKKEAVTVISRDPLQIKAEVKQPEGLNPYETSFITAYTQNDSIARRKGLQDMMVALVQSIGEKMKGFSQKETIVYYQDIIKQAWQQVESAKTPEVKSEKYSENMDWTMLDKESDTRTQTTFGGGPVFMPGWWWRADPTISRTSTSMPHVGGAASIPTGGRSTTISIPSLPGSNAAASLVGTVQSFSSKVVGDITTFTSGVTSKTNPLPVTSSTGGRSGGGGGSHCACACACAGCACACAGGGR